MKKRGIAALLAFVMIIAMCSCGSKDKNDSAEGKTLTIMMSITENGGSDTQIIDEMVKATGVKVEIIRAPVASYGEKLNVTLASGDLPDIVFMSEDNMTSWTDEGALLPLDDLIEEHGKNFKKVFSDEDKKELVNPTDGQLYGMPYILRLPAMSTMGVRRDWLDKLGLEAPDTIEELENVLTEFKNNGEKLGTPTVIPMAGSLSAFYMMYGITETGEQGMWTLDDKGNYVSRFEHPNYKECLETLRRFYQNGLIDPEFLSRNNDVNAIYSLFNSGTAGMGFVYSTRLREITNILQETDKNAFFDYMEPVTGIDGEKRILGRKIFGTLGCITIAAEDKKEECMKFLDWAYSEEGERLFNYGIEGKHYDMVDGKPVIRDDFNKGWVDIRKEGIVPTNMSYNRSLDAYNQCMFYGKDISELNELEKLTYKAYYENEKYIVSPIRSFSTETSLKKGTDIYASLKEKEAKAITGKISIDDFFGELDKIKKNGLDDITKEMQKCWKSVNKN